MPIYLAVYVQDNGRGDDDITLGRIKDPGLAASIGIRQEAEAVDPNERTTSPHAMALTLTDSNNDGISIINFVVDRIAVYDNVVNYYKVTDSSTGQITVNGQSRLPGDSDYLQLAFDNSNILVSTSNQRPDFATADRTATSRTIAFTASESTWMPYVFVRNTGSYYTPYAIGNNDKYDHFKSAQDFIYVEDLPGGGDNDFNDIIVKISKLS